MQGPGAGPVGMKPGPGPGPSGQELHPPDPSCAVRHGCAAGGGNPAARRATTASRSSEGAGRSLLGTDGEAAGETAGDGEAAGDEGEALAAASLGRKTSSWPFTSSTTCASRSMPLATSSSRVILRSLTTLELPARSSSCSRRLRLPIGREPCRCRPLPAAPVSTGSEDSLVTELGALGWA